VNADRAFHIFFEMCSADEVCAQSYPRLERDFYALVTGLNREPVTVRVEDTGTPLRVVVRGETYIGMLFSSLYSTRATAEMPRIILDALSGDHTYAGQFQLRGQFRYEGVSIGMHLAVVCGDTVPDTPYEILDRADDAFPLQNGYFDAGHYRDLCAIWDVPPSDPATREPIYSDRPVLLLSGDFDPVTPPDYAAIAAETLPSSYLYTLPNIGHFISSNDCAREIIQDFLDEPSREPDTACLEAVPPVAFLP
jgi:pimeloyl-ACP methyl ester carboxylesterase